MILVARLADRAGEPNLASMRRLFHAVIFLWLLLACLSPLKAQQAGPCPFTRLTENQLVYTAWQYRRMVHSATGKTLHRGGDEFPSYLLFRADNTLLESTNGYYREGRWSLTAGRLHATYRGLESFCADMPKEDLLILGFEASGPSPGRQYHFERVELDDTPFHRSPYDLPLVIVERDKRRADGASGPWWAFWRKWFLPKDPPAPPPVPILIEVSGGGYYGGLNPVYRQFVRITGDGGLVREVVTEREGSMVTRRRITRRELEDFAEWIDSQGYFGLSREFDCEDQACWQRKRGKPRPVPLQLVVSYGKKYHRVTIHLFGPDNRNLRYVDYPPVIDQIVETVYRMADRPQ